MAAHVNLHFSFFPSFFLSYSSSRTHSEGVCEAPVKLPLSPVRQVEDLFEIFSEALQRGQTAAVLQHDRGLTTVLCCFFFPSEVSVMICHLATFQTNSLC